MVDLIENRTFSCINSTNELPSRLGSALGAITAFLFIIFGIFGDSLIIIAILSKKELRNNLVNIFIVSLQLNDIFNIGFNQFLVGLSYTFMEWHGPDLLCEIFVYTTIICTGSLLWHHALISIHRYLVVVCDLNLRYFGVSPKFYTIVSIIIARLIPILVCIPALIDQKRMIVYSKAALRCMLAPNVSGFQNLLIVLINMLIPCLIVIFCFAHIFARVHTVSKKIRKSILSSNIYSNKTKLNSQVANEIIKNYSKYNPNNADLAAKSPTSRGESFTNEFNQKSEKNKEKANGHSFMYSMGSIHREIQITKMFAIIFTVFLFGYLPYGIIRLIDEENSLHPDVYVLLTVVFIISISVSPIIYGLMNTQIRKQCVLLIRSLFGCQKTSGPDYEIAVANVKASQISVLSPNMIKAAYDLNKKNFYTKKLSFSRYENDDLEEVENKSFILKTKQASNTNWIAKLTPSNEFESKIIGLGENKNKKMLVSLKKNSKKEKISLCQTKELVVQYESSCLSIERKGSNVKNDLNSEITNNRDSFDFLLNDKRMSLQDDGGVYKGPS